LAGFPDDYRQINTNTVGDPQSGFEGWAAQSSFHVTDSELL